MNIHSKLLSMILTAAERSRDVDAFERASISH
jgi:hypothetical protein